MQGKKYLVVLAFLSLLFCSSAEASDDATKWIDGNANCQQFKNVNFFSQTVVLKKQFIKIFLSKNDGFLSINFSYMPPLEINLDFKNHYVEFIDRKSGTKDFVRKRNTFQAPESQSQTRLVLQSINTAIQSISRAIKNVQKDDMLDKKDEKISRLQKRLPILQCSKSILDSIVGTPTHP